MTRVWKTNEEPTIPFSGLCVRGMLKAAGNRLCLERKILPCVGKVEKTPGQPRRLAEPPDGRCVK